MDEGHLRNIQKIAEDVHCAKDFRCIEAKNEFKYLCRARDLWAQKYVECLENEPMECKFALPYSEGHFCRCPVRIHIMKELGK